MSVLLLPGTAQPGDVLTGKKFSAGSNYGASGSMPDNGSPIWTPNTADQAIAAGHYSGGTVKGDANLVTGNIRAGVTLFGVAGKSSVVDTASATAGAGDILTGKSAFVNGASIAGSMPNKGAPTFSPGVNAQAIAAGYYSGGTVNGDANLIAANILSGKSIFGVAGIVSPRKFASGTQTATGGGNFTVSGLSFQPTMVVVEYTNATPVIRASYMAGASQNAAYGDGAQHNYNNAIWTMNADGFYYSNGGNVPATSCNWWAFG